MDHQVQLWQDHGDDFQPQASIVRPDPQEAGAAVCGGDGARLDGVDDVASMCPADPVPSTRLRPGQLRTEKL